jgi:hypothetical protein
VSRRPRYGPRWPQRSVLEWMQAIGRLGVRVRHAAACVVFWDVLGKTQDNEAYNLFSTWTDKNLRRYPSDAELAAALVRVGYAPRYAVRRAKTPPDYKTYSRTCPGSKRIGARWGDGISQCASKLPQPWTAWGNQAI